MVPPSSTVSLGRLGLLAAFLFCGFSGGCSRIMGPKQGGDPIPDYPDGPAGLHALFSDVLAAAKADDRARVHDLFQSLKMSRAELDALFGSRAAELAPPYDEMMATLIHRGAVELVGLVYEKKYDTVEVLAVPLDLGPSGNGGDGGATAPVPDGGIGEVRAEDVPLARALVSPPPIYAVLFKKADAPQTTRYNFFFYRGGKWRTGNQLGRLLAKRERELHPPPVLPWTARPRMPIHW